MKEINFPVIIKPDDSGAAVGIKICNSIKELKKQIKVSLGYSKKKKIICQKFLSGDDMQAFYTIYN